MSIKSRIALDDHALAALDTGARPGEDRPAVLFVPGYTGSKEDFQPLLRPLGAAGYRAVAIDQRGQYQSDWAADPADYALPALAADVLSVARILAADSSMVHLVGHSFGGLVGRAAVLTAPSVFASYTLMGSGPGPIGGERRRALDASEPMLIERGLPETWQVIARRSQANPAYARTAPALIEFLRTRFLANDPKGLLAMAAELRTVIDVTPQLAEAGVPLLVLHGVDDDAWPPELQRATAERLGAAYVVIERAAHSPAVENPPDTLAALQAFWASIAAGRQLTGVPSPAQDSLATEAAWPSGHNRR